MAVAWIMDLTNEQWQQINEYLCVLSQRQMTLLTTRLNLFETV